MTTFNRKKNENIVLFKCLTKGQYFIHDPNPGILYLKIREVNTESIFKDNVRSAIVVAAKDHQRGWIGEPVYFSLDAVVNVVDVEINEL